MEKQTIGKFIAALRKANGMTQQGLADRLNVSNKSVSKWECDEGYPDLSLIPVIAEVFGVTSDEILKGARIIKESAPEEQEETAAAAPEKQPQKSEKQFNYLIQEKLNRFKYLSLIPIALSVIGFIFIMMSMNWQGYTVFAVVCFVAMFFLQAFFMISSKSALYNPDLTDEKDLRILRAVRTIETYSFHVITASAAILINGVAFPAIGYPDWFFFLLSSVPAVYAAAYIIKVLTADRKYFDISEQPEVKERLKRLNIACVTCGAVALGVAIILHFVMAAANLDYSFGAVYYVTYSAAVSITALVYLLNRRTLLYPHRLIK